jgi:hypothetical protein
MSVTAEAIPYAKNLTKDEITNFLKSYLPKFKGFNSIRCDGGINVALFIGDDPNQLLIDINTSISTALNDYIEEIFEEPSKKYNRNIIFYESEVKDKALFLRW